MFDLERAVKKWRKSHLGMGSIEDGDLAELESHLRDEIDSLIGQGKSAEEAFLEAVGKNAGPAEMGVELFRAHARRRGRRRPLDDGGFTLALLRSNAKMAIRKMKKYKGSTVINIAGLAVGLTFFILVGLYIQFELGFDRFHKNGERIFRVEQILVHDSGPEATAGCPTPLFKALPADLPEVEAASRVVRAGPVLITTPENTRIEAPGAFYVDGAFLSMFSFPLLKGDAATALSEPNTLVLTKSLARKVFHDKEPLGRVVRVDDDDFKITGVAEEVPANSHLQFEALLSVSTISAESFTRWFDNWVPLYIMTTPGQSAQALGQKIRYFLKKYQGDRSRNELYLRPLPEIHLQARVHWEPGLVGSSKNVLIFAAVSILTLLLACINFMNLATARSTDRALEVGMRKVAGADRPSLVKQFLGESLITVIISMVLALFAAWTVLPSFGQIVNRRLVLDPLHNWPLTVGLLGLTLIVGGLAGSYPAFVLSSFRPARVLRGVRFSGGRNPALRKALVVFQFFISISLIIGALVILRQNRFLMNRDLGYTTDQVVVVPMRGPREKFAAFRQELLRNPNILNVADSDYLPYDSSNWTNVSWEGAGPEDYIKINVNYVDENFIPTFAMTVLKGRAFTEGMRSWKENAAILNEAAARKIGWDDPVGKRLLYNVDYRSRTVGGATVVGVVKDFHFLSLHHPIGPFMLRLGSKDWLGGNLYAKISTRDVSGTIASMKKVFETAYPGFDFAYRFLDEDFRQVYMEERKAGRIVSGLSLIAVFIACLGLVGLSSLAIGQKTKEIGIRRVMGAPISEIALRLTREFLFLVALANVLAWPAAYLAVREWLNNFPYRIDLGWPVFLLAGGAALVIAFATVGLLAFRAAAADPVESLRYE